MDINKGGYLIPHFIDVPKKGLWAKILRFFKIKRGWKTIDLHKKLDELIGKED